MAYFEEFRWEPYEESEDQDMWVASISFNAKEPDQINHSECIEVRADNEALLDDRVTKILDVLNSNDTTVRVES